MAELTRSTSAESATGNLDRTNSQANNDAGKKSFLGTMRGCMNPIARALLFRKAGKRAKKILREIDDSGHVKKKRKNAARVRFRLPKSKAVRVIQPFEADSTFIRRWRHLMAGPLCYEVWAFPFRLAFGDTGFHSSVVADMLCDSMFLLSAAFKCSTVVAVGTLPDQDEPIRSFSGIVGVYLRKHFLWEFGPMIIYYIATFVTSGSSILSLSLWWLATVPRMFTRGRQLMRYFADMSNDLQVNARALESIKFALIIILSSHWVGCLFYWLSRIMDHNHTTWVHEFQILLPLFDKEHSSLATKYLLCLYKGFNAFSNLGYDYGMPRNWVDMIYSLFVMAAQVYLSALILGTLLNYLVRNNPAEEQHKQTIAALSAHVEEKNIPAELRDRMLRHFNFQHKKNLGRNTEMLWFLPKGLTVKVAYHKYQSTMDKCALEGNAFHGCEQAFLDDCLSRLKVMHFTPGELLIKKGDLPRELYMVVDGALVMMDDDNRVLTVIRADVPDMPPYANIAPFMIGVHYHHPLIAGLDGECTTLILTKEDSDALFQAFPAERERIRENILATYGLLPNGEDMALSEEKKASLDQGEWLEMREPVRHALKSQRLHTLADFEQAVEAGDIDKLLQLISKGVSPNLKNYDGRTGLHVACAKGHSKVVEMLLDQKSDPNLRDRWGRTPLLEAIHYRQKAIVGLLEQRQAEVNAEYLRERLLSNCIWGRVEKVRQILEVGGIDLNVGNYDGRTALHFAASHGHEEVVDLLLRAKADINAKDRFGGTPLKDCVVSGHALLATILRTRGGVLPEGLAGDLICTAAGEGDIQTLKLLFESNENMNTGDYDARCALHLAAAEARILAVSFLLTHTADPNSEDRWGGRPMDDALRGGTLYHLYCGKLIQSWGGTAGTLQHDHPKLHTLHSVDIAEALTLVQRLTALGFDKRRIERVGEQELLTSFESCMRVVPLVATIKGHAEVLAACVEETSESLSAIVNDILLVIDTVAKRLSPTAGIVRAGTVRDLKKMTRVNMWEKVRKARESNLLTWDVAHSPHGMGREGSRKKLLPRVPSDKGPVPPGRARSPQEHKKDESASLSVRCKHLQVAMQNVREEQAEDDHGADEFEFYACVNGIESDEEEALHEELDRVEAQMERADEQGTTPQKMAANAFLKASTNLMMISESFVLLRSLFVNPKFGGMGVAHTASSQGRYLGDNGGNTRTKGGPSKPEDEDQDEAMVTQYDIIRVMDVLQISVCNDDIDAIVEEAETYSLQHTNQQVPQRTGSVSSVASAKSTHQHHHGGAQGKEASTPSNDTSVPLAAVLAGSQSFRLLVCDMRVNHQLCALLESRLGELLSEAQCEQLEVCDERRVTEGELVHPSLSNDGRVFFLVRSGFLSAVHPDAALAPQPDPGKGGGARQTKKKDKHLSPVHVKQGDVFGAYRALKPGHVEREVSARSEAVLLAVTCASLKAVIGTDVRLALAVQSLMAESPSLTPEEEHKEPRGLLSRTASLRKMREGVTSAFARARRPSGGLAGFFASTGGYGEHHDGTHCGPSSPGTNRHSPAAAGSEDYFRRAGSASSNSNKTSRMVERVTSVGEIQRRGLSETMALLGDLWMCLTMGHRFIARPLLEVVGQSLGEASSYAFAQVFFPPHRELEHLLLEDEFWRCWLAFTAEQGLDEAQEEEGGGVETDRLKDDDDDSEGGGEEEGLVKADAAQKHTWFERFVARFSPSRSLKKRFFEPHVIDQYEPAYLQITGDLKVPLPLDKVVELLSSIFDDLPFRISKHNAREFMAAFANPDHKSGEHVTWADIRSVLKKRRMTVQEPEHGILLNNALDPRSRMLRTWNSLVSFIALYYLTTVPVRAAFLPWDSMLHIMPLSTDLPLDLLTTINFFVALNTAYRNRRSAWITSRVRIAKKLPLSLWVSALPLDWLAWLAGADNEVACFCRLPRMGLILAKRSFAAASRDKGVRSQIERMLNMVAVTVHLSSCVWYFLGRSYHKWVTPDFAVSWYKVDPSLAHLTYERTSFGWNAKDNVWSHYLLSVHWVAATLTVNGMIGPVVPQNGVELVFCILLMVLNMTLFRWIIGEISSIIMNADMHMVKRREEYSQYRSFIELNHLPEDLCDEIMAHFHASHRDSMVAQEKILAGLCASLQVDRARFLYREIVGNINVFGGCSDSFLDALCVVVSEVHFNPEEPLFETSVHATELLMIVSGGAETFVDSPAGEIKDGEYEEGCAPGVLAFFFDTRHVHTGRAARAGATCLRLNRSQFSDIVLLFPTDEATIANNVLTQLKKQNKAMSMGYAQSTASHGARSQGVSVGGMSSMRGSAAQSHAYSKASQVPLSYTI